MGKNWCSKRWDDLKSHTAEQKPRCSRLQVQFVPMPPILGDGHCRLHATDGCTEAHQRQKLSTVTHVVLRNPASYSCSLLESERGWKPCNPYSPRQPQAEFRSKAPLPHSENTPLGIEEHSVTTVASLRWSTDGQVHRNMVLPCGLSLLRTPSPTLLDCLPPRLLALKNQLPKLLSSHSWAPAPLQTSSPTGEFLLAVRRSL